MTQRYSPEITYERSWGEYIAAAQMENNPRGDYVRYNAHMITANECKNLIKKNVKLKEQIKVLKEEIKVLKGNV